jgi:reactive intermediate/imine deaminase
MKKAISTPLGPRPAGPYNQGIVTQNLIFTAGFGPQDPATGNVPEGVYAQTRQVLANIRNVLAAEGASLDDVVKVTAYLNDISGDFAEFNRAYGEFFAKPFPVRTTVGVNLSGILVEIDVVANRPTEL